MASQFKHRVGLNIRKYRLESNQTLRQIADKVGVTEATMQKYEAGNIGRVDIEMLKSIADAIGCTPNDLTGWKADKPSSNIDVDWLVGQTTIIEQLSPRNKDALADYARFLLSQQKSQNTDTKNDTPT